MLLPDAFDSLFHLQRALDNFQSSPWLQSGPSAGGTYPPLNVFRKDHDFVVVTELPGIDKADLDIQVKGNTIRISGHKAVSYPDGSVHRRERMFGDFDRTLSIPVQLDPDAIKAEYRDGVLTLVLPRAERDKPRNIQIS